MATDKKSFLLYADIIHTINKLPNDSAGVLFKLILEYVNDLNPNIESYDLLIQITFEPIRQQLKRDLEKWDLFREKQSVNGKMGGRPKKEVPINKTQNNPSLYGESQKSLNVNANVSVNANAKKEIAMCQDHLSITWDDMNKLVDLYGEEVATTTCMNILNYRKNIKYKSLYLTALKWIKKDLADAEMKRIEHSSKIRKLSF